MFVILMGAYKLHARGTITNYCRNLLFETKKKHARSFINGKTIAKTTNTIYYPFKVHPIPSTRTWVHLM